VASPNAEQTANRAAVARVWDGCEPPVCFDNLIDPWQGALVRFSACAKTDADPLSAWHRAAPHMRWDNQGPAMQAALLALHASAREGQCDKAPPPEVPRQMSMFDALYVPKHISERPCGECAHTPEYHLTHGARCSIKHCGCNRYWPMGTSPGWKIDDPVPPLENT
jgi:hypothetical protein